MKPIKGEYFSEEMIEDIKNCLSFSKPKQIGFFTEYGKVDDVLIPDGTNVSKIEIADFIENDLCFKVYFGSIYIYITLIDTKDMIVYIDDKSMDFTTKYKGNLHITLSKSIYDYL